MEEQKSCKVYVDVGVEFTAEGKMRLPGFDGQTGIFFRLTG